jgi:C1A family cysteine protease
VKLSMPPSIAHAFGLPRPGHSNRRRSLARSGAQVVAVAAMFFGSTVAAGAEPGVSTTGHSLGMLPDTAQTLARVPAHARMSVQAVLPAKIDLSGNLPPIGDQGQEGSCVAWSTGYYLASFQEGREHSWNLKDPLHQFSPAFVYNQINGGADNGSSPSAAFNLLQKKGVASLAAMPYRAGDYRTQPSANQNQDALPYTIGSWSYFQLGDVAGMKAHLAGGDPVSLSVPVYSNFAYPTDPCNKPIGAPTGTYYGGHQITLVGYDDTKQAFRFANSWGTGWGCQGYAWLSYSFVAQSAWNGYSMIGKPDTLGIVSGGVADATTHAAIAGAVVTVGGYTITSDAKGAYALAVPTGNQTVKVTAAGYTTSSQLVQVSSGNTVTLTANLTQARGTLTGLVTDSTTRAAVVGARVTVGTLSATTATNGSWTLVVPAGPQTVSVSATGYTSSSQAAQAVLGSTTTMSTPLVKTRAPGR